MTLTATVAVTGLGATDNPAPGLAVIRSLRAHPEFAGRIVGLVYDSLEPGIYARDLVDDVFLLPYPSEGLEALEARLRYLHERVPLDAVIPCLDAELASFIALEPVLGELGIGSLLPTAEQLELRSKAHLVGLGSRAGLPVPRTKVISDPGQLLGIEAELPYPFWVKGCFYGAERVLGLHDALPAFHRSVARWGLPVVLQEEVRGDEVDVVALGDGKGGLVGAVPMKKMLLTDRGKGWAGLAIQDELALQLTARFMEATRWRGPCEVELVRDAQGALHLLEINPRFPAWSYMAAGAGHNLAWATLQLALGQQPAPLPAYRVGTMFMRLSLDHIAELSDFEAMVTDGEIVGRSR